MKKEKKTKKINLNLSLDRRNQIQNNQKELLEENCRRR